MSLFSRLGVGSGLNRFYEPRLVFFTAREIIFCDWSLNCLHLRRGSFCLTYRGSFIIRCLLNICRFLAGHAVFSGCNNSLSCSSLIDNRDISCLRGLRLTRNSTDWCWDFLWSGLLLAFVAAIEISARFLLSWYRSLRSSLYGFLHSRRVFGWTLLRVWIRAINFFVETDDVAHAFFQHRLLYAITTHCNKLVWPKFLQVTYFTSSHYDWASNDERVVLQKFKFFQAQTCENLAVVRKYLDSVRVWSHWTC